MTRTFVCALALACGASCVAGPALAAETTQPGQPYELESLSVVGTRLSAEAGGERPIVRIEVDELINTGAQNLGQLLQLLPQMIGSPLNTGVGARGAGGGLSRGIETLDMRGLGSQRSLILVNGRRFIAGGNGTAGVVDLASLPLSAVAAVEVLSGSASVEYGADAVAGVVNIITHKQAKGASFGISGSLTERGDGQQWQANASWGQSGQDQHWFLAAQLNRQSPVGKADRRYSADQLSVQGPQNVVFSRGISSAPPAGNYRTSQGRLTLIDGEDGTSPDDFRPFINNGVNSDRFNYNPFEDLVQDNQRQSLFGSWNYQGFEHLDIYARGLLQNRESSTTLAPLPFFTNRLPGVSVAADNLFNPFGEELVDVRRRLVEAGPRRYSQQARLWRTELGAQGSWAQWEWSAQLSYGQNRVEQIQSGDLRRDRLQLALGPSFRDQDGQPRCGSPELAIEGCIPLNLFGGPGSISQEMLDYAGIAPLRDSFSNAQTLVNWDARRDLAQLAAGPLELAWGLEWRAEEARDIPAELTQTGATTGAARAATRGSFRSREVYLEMGVPVWRNAITQQGLQAEFGLRVLDTSLFSPRAVVDAGLRLQLAPGLIARAGYAQSYRTPTVGELFAGVSQTNPAVNDPCAEFNNLAPEEQQRCVNQGVPADGSFSDNGNEVPLLSGGSTALRPETAQTWRLSLDWSPNNHTQVRLAAFDIDIDQAIAGLSAESILRQCITNADLNACARIQRDDQGRLLQINSPLSNIAQDRVQGLDIEASWRPRLGAWSLAHRLLLSHIIERQIRTEPNVAALASAGEYSPDVGAIPQWTGLYSLQASTGAWRWLYSLQYIHGMDERGGDLFAGSQRRISSRSYHDLSLSWSSTSGWDITAVIGNLTDRQPPLVINADDANTDVATYRLLGRRYSLNWELSF